MDGETLICGFCGGSRPLIAERCGGCSAKRLDAERRLMRRAERTVRSTCPHCTSRRAIVGDDGLLFCLGCSEVTGRVRV